MGAKDNMVVEPIPLERALEEAYRAGQDSGKELVIEWLSSKWYGKLGTFMLFAIEEKEWRACHSPKA